MSTVILQYLVCTTYLFVCQPHAQAGEQLPGLGGGDDPILVQVIQLQVFTLIPCAYADKGPLKIT